MPGFKIKEQEGYDLSTAEKETVEAIAVLGDPGADRILFWDESANTWKFLTVGSGLTITATTLTSTGISNPMTAIGDMIYGDTAGAVARLAGNTTTTKKFLTSVGDGTNSTAPAYSLDFSTDGTLAGNSDTIIPSQKAIKTYVDGSVAGLLDYRGGYDASGNTYPTTGGSGTAGAVLKGDMWIISVAGTLGGEAVQVGDSIIANVDTPAQTASNWNHLNANISYVPENVANRLTSFQGTPDNTHYASEKLVKDSLDAKQDTMTKASSSDIDSGTDDAKYITSKGLEDSTNYGKKQTSVTSSATPTPTGNYKKNEYYLTALAVGATFAAPSGTPANGNNLIIRIKDNGTARALTWNAIYRAIGVVLPTTTVANKTIYIGCKYNSADNKWDVLAIGSEE